MRFEVGKYYSHTTGDEMAILCESETTLWGKCYIAETNTGELKPVGNDESCTANYTEITKEKWMANFS